MEGQSLGRVSYVLDMGREVGLSQGIPRPLRCLQYHHIEEAVMMMQPYQLIESLIDVWAISRGHVVLEHSEVDVVLRHSEVDVVLGFHYLPVNRLVQKFLHRYDSRYGLGTMKCNVYDTV
jgi:hypothetical protein